MVWPSHLRLLLMHYKSMIYGKQFNIFVLYVIAYFTSKCFAVVEYDRHLRPKSQRCLYSKELAAFARDSGSNMR